MVLSPCTHANVHIWFCQGPQCIFFLLYLDYVLCSFMFRAYSRKGEQALLLLMHNETTAISPLMCPYQMNVAYYRHSRVSWVALWTKKGLQGTMKETLSKIDHTVPL